MKLRRMLCLALTVLLLTAAGCSSALEMKENEETGEQTQTTSELENEKTAERETGEAKKTYSILFIGNSYTYYNDMPATVFRKIADAAGVEVKVRSITNGGHTLEKMANPADPYGVQVQKALKSGEKYDYVILQEQSVRPASKNAEKFYQAVRSLVGRIRAIGAEPVLYATWGRKTGHATLAEYGWTNESMTWRLAAAYEAIGKELNIPVAHAGLAFYDVYTAKSGVELYSSDSTHPSYAGSFLAANTIFARIFQIDPVTVEFNGDLSEETAKLLRSAASRAVFQTPEIPEEYRTASEGV